MKAEAHFDRRQKQIINEVNRAKYCIWIAEAWFDDKAIYEALINKARAGLNVEIILLGDNTRFDNNALNYCEFMDAGGELYYLNEDDSREIKYNEFCIIDFKTVICGSYRKVPSNKQKNIAIFKNFEHLTSTFTNEYMEMKNSYSKCAY